MLLTGYGLEPVPRRAAGWGALASDRTPPAAWAAARRALGLSRRQAVAVRRLPPGRSLCSLC